jgi:hypothetical protein
MNLYIPQLQFTLQDRCNSSKRENRQNGNEEGSQEGTCKEGRKEGREEEVIATIQQQANVEGDALERPLRRFVRNEAGYARPLESYVGRKDDRNDAPPLDCRALG